MIPNRRHLISSPEEMFALGVSLSKSLSKKSLLLLYGPLGAGKTTLVKGLAHGCCSVHPDEVTSPTFTYLHIYENLYHFDLYRLSSEEEFFAKGFDEYLTKPGITCIEWPEKIRTLSLPPSTSITISYDTPTTRIVTLS